MNDIEVSLQDTQNISTQVYDINYIPDYVKAEQERRENEVIRQANELLRIALYEDLEYKKDTDYWRGTGIASIEKTDTEGLVDTYTITYENGYTSTFTVTNGKYDRIAGANATIDDNIGTPSVTVNTTSILAPDGTGYIKNFSFNFSNLKGEKGEQGERGEAGSIKFLIVAELPQTGADDTIYLVPITPDEGDNNYAEYIYVNGEWELLGKIGVHVDLTDYYTKGETNTLLNAKENTSNKVTSISNSSTDTQYPSAKCVYDSQATQDTKITNLENQVFGDETIEAENTSMTLNETLKGQFNELDLKGNTSQTGTPTPSSPIPVNVVSGDNEINICGENLFHSDGINLATLSGITSSFDNSSISLNGSNTSAGYVISNRTATNITLEAGTYYFSIFLLSGSINRGSNQGEFTIKTSDGRTGITLSNIINSPSGYTKSFTATEKTTLETDFYLNGAITFTNVVLGIEISKQTPTTYEPYQGNTYEVDLPSGMELCKIGNYQDYIYKDSDKWYLHKVIGKYNIDTSTLGIKTNYTNIEYATIPKPNNYLGYGSFDKVEIICKSASHIAQAPSGWNDANLVNKISGNPEANRWWLGFSKGTGITAIQNALNGSYIYYPLATPTTTEITDTTLISQLNALEQATSKENQTNISQVNNDLPFIISTSAFLNNINGKIGLLNKLTEV